MHRDLWVIVAVTGALLAPFATKAFHVDDPLYLWGARHILSEPLRPYDFSVNWAGNPEISMWRETKNPPLMCYWLAAGIALFGERELPLHLWALPFALLAAVSMYFLARRHVKRPLWPTLALIVCPGFLVSATSVMADVPALALLLAGYVLFIEGVERRWPVLAALGALALGAAALTKYMAIGGVGLAALSVLLRRRGDLRALLWLLVPVGLFTLWGLYGVLTHGQPHFAQATGFSMQHMGGLSLTARGIAALSFIGGCAVWPIVLAWPMLKPKKGTGTFFAQHPKGLQAKCTCTFFRCAGAAIVAAACCAAVALVGSRLYPTGATLPWQGHVTLFFFVFGGAAGIWLAVAGLRKREEGRLTLSLWLFGVLIFAVFLNWMVNARTILFLLPPLAILSWQAMESWSCRGSRVLGGAAIGLSAAVSLLMALTDLRMANSYRTIASQIAYAEGRVLFPSHWGFQYYMERRGFLPMDFRHGGMRREDLIVTAEIATASSAWFGLMNQLQLVSVEEMFWPLRLHTMDPWSGSGFYASYYGPLPYGVGSAMLERFRFYRLPEEATGDSMRR